MGSALDWLSSNGIDPIYVLTFIALLGAFWNRKYYVNWKNLDQTSRFLTVYTTITVVGLVIASIIVILARFKVLKP